MNKIRYNSGSDRVELSSNCQMISIDYGTLVELLKRCRDKPDVSTFYEDPKSSSDRCDVVIDVDGISNSIVIRSFSNEDDAMDYAKTILNNLECESRDYLKVCRNGMYAVRKDRIRAVKVI